MEHEEYQPDYNGEQLRIGIVQSRFNAPLGELLRKTCIENLHRLGVDDEDILVVTVPGALEIPLAIQKLAESSQFDALIAVGAVIRGETYHFEIVAQQSATGISQVMLDVGVPVINAILTTDDVQQAQARLAEKAEEAAKAAVELGNLCTALEQLTLDEEDSEL